MRASVATPRRSGRIVAQNWISLKINGGRLVQAIPREPSASQCLQLRLCRRTKDESDFWTTIPQARVGFPFRRIRGEQMSSPSARKIGGDASHNVAQVSSIFFDGACLTFARATKNDPVRFAVDKINNE